MRMSRLSVAVALVLIASMPLHADLIITGVADPNGGTGDLVELFATADIADLSIYGVDVASNGAASSTPDFTFAVGGLSAGSFYYLTGDQVDFTQFFGFAADETSMNGINGNDSIYLYQSGSVIDVYGFVPNFDFTGNALEYSDGWAYRKDGTGASGNASATVANWTATKSSLGNSNDETNAGSPTPMPIGTYAVPEPSAFLFGALVCGLVGLGNASRGAFRRARG